MGRNCTISWWRPISCTGGRAVEFGRLYPRAASGLYQAPTFLSGGTTVQYLHCLVARSYLVSYAKAKVDVLGFLRYLLWGYPAIFRRYLLHFLLATAIFL